MKGRRSNVIIERIWFRGPFNIANPNMKDKEPKVEQRANLRGRRANIGRPTNIPNEKNTNETIRLATKILNLVE